MEDKSVVYRVIFRNFLVSVPVIRNIILVAAVLSNHRNSVNPHLDKKL